MDRGTSSDDITAFEKTIRLSPFVTVRECGQIHNFAKSAVRALDILELLADVERPLRAIEIARSLGLSPSSADQILKTMLDSGYLTLDAASKRYHLPARLMRLGAALSAAYFAPEAMQQLLRAVQRASGVRVLLAAPQGAYMQLVDVCDSADAPRFIEHEPVLKGLHTPFFGSCTGAAWLSSQSEATVRRLIHKCRRELGARADDVEGLLESVRRVRKQGYAFGGLMAEDGLWSVAVPLPPAANGLVLVLVVAGPACAIENSEARLAALMKSSIERYLGADVTSR